MRRTFRARGQGGELRTGASSGRFGGRAAEPDPCLGAVPELSHLFDERLLDEYERATLERRFANVNRYIRRVSEAARTLQRGELPPPVARGDAPDRESLARAIVAEFAHGGRAGLKRSVARRMTDAIGKHYLWSSLSSLPVFHELTVLGPWALSQSRLASFERTVDYLSGQFLSGIVLPLDLVREQILASEEVYLAHCACRSSGVADDLMQNGQVFTIVGAEQARLLLDRLLDRYEALGRDRTSATTGPKMRSILEGLCAARRSGTSEARLEDFLRASWPDWEILPVLPGYTTRWIRSLSVHGKCEPVDRELVVDMLDIWYFGRGAVFNSMKAVDTPYTICTCPSPENGGGCVLTNWYYFGRLNHSLAPAQRPGARRCDARGRAQPCRYFPVRARRACIGCGCAHGDEDPRDLVAALRRVDEMRATRGR